MHCPTKLLYYQSLWYFRPFFLLAELKMPFLTDNFRRPCLAHLQKHLFSWACLGTMYLNITLLQSSHIFLGFQSITDNKIKKLKLAHIHSNIQCLDQLLSCYKQTKTTGEETTLIKHSLIWPTSTPHTHIDVNSLNTCMQLHSQTQNCVWGEEY